MRRVPCGGSHGAGYGEGGMAEKKAEQTDVAQAEAASRNRRRSNRQAVDPVIPDAIGRQLRAFYQEVANEPVPDRFTELLNRLAEEQDNVDCEKDGSE